MIMLDHLITIFIISMKFTKASICRCMIQDSGYVDLNSFNTKENSLYENMSHNCKKNTEEHCDVSHENINYQRHSMDYKEHIEEYYNNEHHIYEEIDNKENEQQNSKLETFPKISDKALIWHNETIYTKNTNISVDFKNFVIDLKKQKDILEFQCMWDDESFNNYFDKFLIEFYPVRFRRKYSNSFLFFYEFKRTLLEIIFFVDDHLRINSTSKNFNFDRLYNTLMVLHRIFFIDRDFEEYFDQQLVKFVSDREDEDTAIDVLNKLFFPSEMLKKDNKITKWAMKLMDKNTKRNQYLKSGFECLDYIFLQLGNQLKRYHPRFYIISVILQNTRN